MRHISRLTLGLSALAFACALGASGPARAIDEAPKPKTEEGAEPKHEESKDAKREDKTEKTEEKTGAQNDRKAKAAREEKHAEKPTDKKSRVEDAAYLRKLGQVIRARSPGVTNLGEGSAVVRFRLGASGAPSSVTIVSASTPRHGQLARSIVSGMRAPPPPGGSYDGVQSFRFH